MFNRKKEVIYHLDNDVIRLKNDMLLMQNDYIQNLEAKFYNLNGRINKLEEKIKKNKESIMNSQFQKASNELEKELCNCMSKTADAKDENVHNNKHKCDSGACLTCTVHRIKKDIEESKQKKTITSKIEKLLKLKICKDTTIRMKQLNGDYWYLYNNYPLRNFGSDYQKELFTRRKKYDFLLPMFEEEKEYILLQLIDLFGDSNE